MFRILNLALHDAKLANSAELRGLWFCVSQNEEMRGNVEDLLAKRNSIVLYCIVVVAVI